VKIVLWFDSKVNDPGIDLYGGIMNTLSYGLLALLTRCPRTGYELMQQIQPMWKAKHSQIYPLLAKLKQSGFVRFVPVTQKDKPDKKVYSITEQGLHVLRQWIPEPTSEPVKRDEMLLKSYCLWLADPEKGRSLFEERIALFEQRLTRLNEMLAELQQEIDEEGDRLGFTSRHFGNYILLQKAIGSARGELDWCRWVLQLLDKKS
jgi:PadR family transcriptional regulator AphA